LAQPTTRTSKGTAIWRAEQILSFVKIIDETVFLISIYNKGEKETIPYKEIEELLKGYL
jgi:hypothetical protein